MITAKYLFVFSPATAQERKANFDDYWVFSQQHGGELFEDAKDLLKKGTNSHTFKIIQ